MGLDEVVGVDVDGVAGGFGREGGEGVGDSLEIGLGVEFEDDLSSPEVVKAFEGAVDGAEDFGF